MAMDFPTSPTNGQVFVSGGIAYTWNGYAWIGGGIPAAGADAPSDGGEYVRVNGVWRLSGQSFVADGLAQQDIPVPANAKMCQLIGTCFNPATTNNQVGLRISYDGTTFLTGAADYISAGFSHSTGTNAYLNYPPATSSFMVLSGISDVISIAHNFSTEFNLTRPSTSVNFNLKTSSTDYHSVASNIYSHLFVHGYCAIGTSLSIKALRLFMSYGGNFGVNSTINVRWMY
jgi:hypothetical protein